MRVLIVEDDPALAALLRQAMEAEGHQVAQAADGETALKMFAEEAPQLTILDLGLPKLDGTEVLRFMRQGDAVAPVLVLTGRQEPETRVACLDLGADDCMFKPFSLSELRARCRALVRRQPAPSLVLSASDIRMDRVARAVYRSGHPVHLTNREYALLEQLLLERGRCVSRRFLLEQVWGVSDSETNVVDVYVNYLRRKLGDRGPRRLIESVRGQGYRMVPGVSAADRSRGETSAWGSAALERELA